MAGLLKDRSFPSLFFAAILGIIIGSYLNSAVEMLPGGASVVKTFFTGSIPIGFGDFTLAKPVVLDLAAIKPTGRCARLSKRRGICGGTRMQRNTVRWPRKFAWPVSAPCGMASGICAGQPRRA